MNVSLDDQVRWVEASLERSRAYWNSRLERERTKLNPVWVAQQLAAGEAALATLKRLAQGEYGA